MKIRSGYSFRTAIGHLPNVVSRLKDIGWKVGPISDRLSTFSHNRWTMLCKKEGLRPIYGVEIAVVKSFGEVKPVTDYWTFFAVDEIRAINDLIYQATDNPDKEPSLLYSQAMAARGVLKITGERPMLDEIQPAMDLYVSLEPASPRGMISEARKRRFSFLASHSNFYPRAEDREMYRIMLGFRSRTQSYPMHILTDKEWIEACEFNSTAEDRETAIQNRNRAMETCQAVMKQGTLLVPEKPKTLRQMCVDGAIKRNISLNDPIYSERLERELRLISEKNFDDYFYIVADMIQWAKERMIVGPARGSSCGSLVCYLLEITAVDPIPYDLVFERFIDTTRADYPDIDIDFSDARRHLVFEYVEQKYGKERVARLGTISMFQTKSALNQVGAALKIPKWMITKVSDSVIVRSKGDSRADLRVADTLETTEAGRELMSEYPEAAIVGRMENHPSNAGQHAAGLILTQEPVINYVAVNARTKAAMCDWQDAKDLNLLKLDALGLTQLSIFERTLELIGKPPTSAWLESLPLDDKAAFDVLNRRHFSGIFQFSGPTLQQIAIEVPVDCFEDIVAMTALCRPGPIGSGGTRKWIERKNGRQPIEVPHPIFEPYTRASLGVTTYQEQIMLLGREIGGLSWADVTVLRKSMSKSMGKEFFDKYGDPWKRGAIAKGVPPEVAADFWDDMCNFGMYCLSGDTELINPHPNQSQPKTITLRDLCVQGGKYSKNPKYKNKQRPFKLLCLQDGKIKPAPVVDVFSSGQRETWLVEVDSGEKIRSTMDHRFLCSDMKYRSLKELKSGDAIVLIGDQSYRKPKKGTGRGGQNWWPKFLSGEPLLKRQIEKLKKIYKKCQICKKRPYQITHHINEDREDNRWENLLPVCRHCHQLHHHDTYNVWSKGYPTKISHIVSISEPKVEDTYDVTMPSPHNNFVANNFVVHNCFNRSHAVAYALVSYWSMYLKAHYPLEFAAATLDAEYEPVRQLYMLRELREEGIEYVPVDSQYSTDRWQIGENDGKKFLVGPLTAIKGIGPASVREILEFRRQGKTIRESLRKKIDAAKTEIDSLFPVADAIKRLHPDLNAIKIYTKPTPLMDVQPGIQGEIVVLVVLVRLHPLNENEPARVAKRGYAVTGLDNKIDPKLQELADKNGAWRYRSALSPVGVEAVNFFVRDDTGDLFCKMSRFEFARLSPILMNGTKQGKSLFAIKGSVPHNFRMLWVKQIKYLGEIDDDKVPEKNYQSQPLHSSGEEKQRAVS